jgi:hypothetical protein
MMSPWHIRYAFQSLLVHLLVCPSAVVLVEEKKRKDGGFSLRYRHAIGFSADIV